MENPFDLLARELANVSVTARFGQVTAVRSGAVDVRGLGPDVGLGDQVALGDDDVPGGEVVGLEVGLARVMSFGDPAGLKLGARVRLLPETGVAPASWWEGRVLDGFGLPLDGRPLAPGAEARPLRSAPPPAVARRALGARLDTSVAALDTILPLVRGQRIGIFAGSGTGKSNLLTTLGNKVKADRLVLALVGERGREVRDLVERLLGREGGRAVIVAATSDRSALERRRAAWTAMAIAETFRDRGEHVLLLVDSLTRTAEAHREVAVTAGENAVLRGFPPSTQNLLASLVERAGPGAEGQGDITGVFSVLVQGSDMEEPLADMARGLLDGHIVLDRQIAERGRFPAIDVRRSVSRALPEAVTETELALIAEARRILAAYETAAPLIQAGLYVKGADAALDRAVEIWPALDAFWSESFESAKTAFEKLARVLSGQA